MKKKFSTHWKSSKQPRKQRKYRATAPLHIKRKLLSSALNPLLRKRYNTRSTPIHKGDTVKIMAGEFKTKTGKVGLIYTQRKKITLEGIQRSKKDGSKTNVLFDPSNLQIQELNVEDKKRVKVLERTKKQNVSEKK